MCVCVCVCTYIYMYVCMYASRGAQWNNNNSVGPGSQSPCTKVWYLYVLDKPRVDYTLARGPIGVSLCKRASEVGLNTRVVAMLLIIRIGGGGGEAKM